MMPPQVARNYEPLPVVLERGEGVWVWDEEGKRYLDMLGAYSAASFGHCHPRLVAALSGQAAGLDTISRAFRCRVLEDFLKRACALTGFDRALPMNSGAEAVETALKAARKWGYEVKGVAPDKAEIICCEGNFHGRTIAATAIAASLGFGTYFAAGTVFFYQGALTLAAAGVREVMTPPVVQAVTATGGLMIACLAVNIWGLAALRVANMLPGLLLAGVLTWTLERAAAFF